MTDNGEGNLIKTEVQFFEMRTVTVSALGGQFDVVFADAGPKDGDIVLGVHGAPATHKMFKRMAEPLVAKGYRVILPNFPGMGWTPIPSSGCYHHTPIHKAQILEGLVEALKIKKIMMVCGHSMGVHVIVHFAALPSIINICKSVCFLSGPGVRPHKRVTPWLLYKYVFCSYYWTCHIPILGSGVVYATSPLFAAVGLRGKTKMSQVYSVYESALFQWDEFEKDLAILHDHNMSALVVHGNEDWFIQIDIAEDSALKVGVKPENMMWYKDGKKCEDDLKDDTLQRALFIEGGDHFIFMKENKILSYEQLSLLQAISKKESDSDIKLCSKDVTIMTT